MKIFWAMIAVLLAALAAVWFMRSPGQSASTSVASDVEERVTNRTFPEPPAPKPPMAPAPSSESPHANASPETIEAIRNHLTAQFDPARVDVVDASTPTPPAPEASKLVEPAAPNVPSTPAPTATPTTPPTPSTPAPAPPPAPPTPDSPSPDDTYETTDPILQALNEQMTGESSKPAPPPPAPTAPTTPKPAASSAASNPAAPAKLVKQDDGTTLVDDRFVLKGSGTKADPYRITWEQLVSADEVYQPRLGRKVLPDRVKMLDGKWVRMSGYIAFPIMATSNDEMLLMLNQWDGCCIGVPPTPFDAVEVKLNKPAKGEQRLRATGTVLGILRVDPYLVKDWLVSLYLMDNADVIESGGTQPTPPPGPAATHAK